MVPGGITYKLAAMDDSDVAAFMAELHDAFALTRQFRPARPCTRILLDAGNAFTLVKEMDGPQAFRAGLGDGKGDAVDFH